MEILSVVSVSGLLVGQDVRSDAVLVEELALVVEGVLSVLVLGLGVERGLPDLAGVVVIDLTRPPTIIAPVIAIPIGKCPFDVAAVSVVALVPLADPASAVDVKEAMRLTRLVLIGLARLVG